MDASWLNKACRLSIPSFEKWHQAGPAPYSSFTPGLPQQGPFLRLKIGLPPMEGTGAGTGTQRNTCRCRTKGRGRGQGTCRVSEREGTEEPALCGQPPGRGHGTEVPFLAVTATRLAGNAAGRAGDREEPREPEGHVRAERADLRRELASPSPGARAQDVSKGDGGCWTQVWTDSASWSPSCSGAAATRCRPCWLVEPLRQLLGGAGEVGARRSRGNTPEGPLRCPCGLPGRTGPTSTQLGRGAPF